MYPEDEELLLRKRSIATYSLHRLHPMLEKYSHPEKMPAVHVVGTNGKGSTATYIAGMLPGTVGLFLSPHVVTWNERISVNGRYITDAGIHRLLQEIKDEELSSFESTFLMALLYFQEHKCDWIVVEAGVGGTHDATNVLHPEVGVITNVSLDHQRTLGTTIEDITMQKMGIIKPGMKLITAATGTARNMIQEHCKKLGVECITVTKALPYEAYQGMNAATAQAAVKAATGVLCTPQNQQVPGRLHHFGDILLDGAHNEAGIQTLLSHNIRADTIIVGIKRGKDAESLAPLLRKLAPRVICTATTEGIPAQELKRLFPGSISAPLDNVLDYVQGTTLITGSLALVGALIPKVAQIPLSQSHMHP